VEAGQVHSDKRARLRESLQAYGCVIPILIDADNHVIHGWEIVKVAKSLGWQTLPTVRIPGLSEAMVRTLRLALNKLQEGSTWDPDALRLEFSELLTLDVDFDLELSGFNAAEIDIVLGEPVPSPESSADSPDRDRPATARLGEIYTLGQHRLACADSRDFTMYDVVLGGETIALTMTDPPYNVAISGHVSGKGKAQHPEFAMASGEMSDSEFESFLRIVLSSIDQRAGDGAMHFVFMDWRHIDALLKVGKTVFQSLENLCVWSKSNAGMGSLYRSQHELVALFKSGTASHTNNVQLGRYGRNRSNIWHYPGVSSFGEGRAEALAMHPTVKPLALVRDAILDVSNRGDLVFDPFLGSGTTLIACEATGRRCAALEIDPHYVDVAIRRWQTVTGQSAILVGSDYYRFDDLCQQRSADEYGNHE
jgi:DNA modification methylase